MIWLQELNRLAALFIGACAIVLAALAVCVIMCLIDARQEC